MRAQLAVAVMVTAVAACRTGPALPPVPSQGGPAWVELQSEHFTMWTDAPVSRGCALIREMEHLRQIVLGVGFENARAQGRSFVIVLRDEREVGVFSPPQFVAYAWTGGSFFQPVIVLPADAADDDSHVITHELTHVISYNVIRSQPSWFAEGLANFFASVRLDPDRAAGQVGKPLPHIVGRLRAHPPTPSAAMFACEHHGCMDDMFYATAWAMFSFLANARPQQLLAYAQRLDELPRESQAQAWREVFPDLTPAKLDHEVRKWLAYGKHTVWNFNVQLRQWPVMERTLRDADVYAVRALMRYIYAPAAPPPAELAMALAADPASLVARLVATAITKSITLVDARRVAAAHPGDWRSWWLVGFAVDWKGDDAREARERACALLAKTPSPQMPDGWCTPRVKQPSPSRSPAR